MVLEKLIDSDRVAPLEALHKISVLLTSTLETKPLLHLIVHQAAELLNADSCSVALLEPETGDLVFHAAVDDIVGKRIPAGRGIMFRSLLEGQAQIVQDVQKDPDHYSKTGEESNLLARSMLAVPLQTPDRKIGVLAAVNRKPNLFTEEDRDLLMTMGSYAAIAIENTKLFEQVQQQARELEKKVEERTAELNTLYQRQASLAAIELSINQQDEIQLILDEVVAEAKRLVTPNGDAFIVIWDEQTLAYTAGASTSNELSSIEYLRRIRKTGGVTQWIMDHQKSFVVTDIRRANLKQLNPMVNMVKVGALVGVPLLAEGKSLGVLYAIEVAPREFSEGEIEFLMALGNRAAAAIAKVNLYNAERAQRAQAEANAAELRERERHLALVNEITQTAIEQHDLKTALLKIADQLTDVFSANGCYIFFWDEELERSAPAYQYEVGDIAEEQRQALQNATYIADMILEAGRAIFIQDLSRDLPGDLQPPPPIFEGRILGLPLISDQHRLGATLLTFPESYSPEPKEIALGEQVARQVTLAISKIQALEAAQRAAEEARTLREAGAAVAATLNHEEAIQLILEQLARVIPYDSASVQLLRDGYLEIVAGRGWPDDSVVIGVRFAIPGNNPNTLVVQTRQPLILEDTRKSYVPFEEEPHNHIRSWLGVPLILHDEIIGMLALDHKQTNYFTEHHARLVKAFADQVAVAIENARLFETTKRNASEAKIVQEILHRLNSVPDLVESFPSITKGLEELTSCERISLALLNENQQSFTMVALNQPHAELSQGMILPISATSAAEDVLAGRIHLTPDLSLETDFYAEKTLYETGVRSRINIPLQTPEGIIGDLNFTWNRLQGYHPDQIPTLSQIANAIALAVQKERLYKAEKIRASKLEQLREAIAEISSHLDLNTLIDAVLENAVALVNASAGEFGLYVEENHWLEIRGCYRMGKDYRGSIIHLGDGVLGHVAQTQTPLLLQDYREFPGRFAQFAGGPWQAAIASPVLLGKKLLGVLALVNTVSDGLFSAIDLQYLNLFAGQVAISLENARLFQAVQTLATVDELTGILNRRRLFELGNVEFEKARRHAIPLAAIMLDIDHFKKVNDTYGHSVGDQVMRELTRRCQEEIRKSDVFGRYGGEEFTILLPHTDQESALSLAQRLQTKISRTPFPTDYGEIPITISLGITTLTNDVPDLASLIDRADTALLIAKNSGRNRIEIYQAQPQT